ncbi:hypothetical protein Glove_364g3 [Diversispora epigaea]|uniref:Iminophenyl-pyruvate dimer synthase domain-containing protein n=1 Tax=Diversispora epigaea TaxID=1348612 RepID=A0A397H9D3_9GLOM|nr:hypothetical protein Glove_364g3 [Diversispora epigaea]
MNIIIDRIEKIVIENEKGTEYNEIEKEIKEVDYKRKTDKMDPMMGDMDMFKTWDRLGFVVENDLNVFSEVQRNTYRSLPESQIIESTTLRTLHALLQMALQIELFTIPPYLYAMYSIKPGNMIGDKLRYLIRHVAAEEIPDVDEEHDIKLNTSSFQPGDINVDSIGDLYEAILGCFEKLDSKIKYYTENQLEPGMGYAPCTGKDGLIIIDWRRITIQSRRSGLSFQTFQKCYKLIKNDAGKTYKLWLLLIIQLGRKTYTDPKIQEIAKAFDASYSYLMLMLQNVWDPPEFIEYEKKINDRIIGELPALMHSVLKPIATLLAEIDQHAGATFGFYDFNESKDRPKQPLKDIINSAYEKSE